METEKPDGFPGLPEEFVRQNAKYMRLLQGFRLLDDDFMSKVFEDKECAQLLLHIILERSDLVVQEVHGQYSIKNLQGRSVRLDILAVDQEGKHYNIEIQRQDEGADARRARYNSSLLDANLTHPGDRYEELRETYVIFITERDVLKAGLPIYHIDRMIQEILGAERVPSDVIQRLKTIQSEKEDPYHGLNPEIGSSSIQIKFGEKVPKSISVIRENEKNYLVVVTDDGETKIRIDF